MKWKIFLVIIFLLLAVAGVAHKDATESTQEAGSYSITFGLHPASIVVNNNQTFFLTIYDSAGDSLSDIASKSPATGLTTDFTIKKADGTSEGKFQATELQPGYFSITHVFAKKGSYSITATLSNTEGVITEVEKKIHVEPNGPSIYFWLFMLTAVVAGAIIASKSDTW